MYWPVGTPRIYATSNNQKDAPSFNFVVSNDGIESENGQSSGVSDRHRRPSLLPPDSAGLGFDPGLASPITPTTPITPITPGIKSVELGYHEEEDEDREGDGNYDDGQGGPQRDSVDARIPLKEPILALRVARTGHLFATITATSMTIWQTKPTAILAIVVRSGKSLDQYGTNVDLLLRPDSAILVVHTSSGYLITYSLATDADSRVYKPHFTSHTNVQRRRQSHAGDAGHAFPDQIMWGPGEGGGVRDASVRFRMVIKVDAGIESALAQDDELVVATRRPAAVQCIRWVADAAGNQTSTELLHRMPWVEKKVVVVEMTHDRPMNLSTWVTSDGRAYAVQKNGVRSSSVSSSTDGAESDPKKLFKGYCFHVPKGDHDRGIRAVINARFSLLAVGCSDGSIRVYSAKDYVGNIPASHTHQLPVSYSSSGRLTTLSYSPDGYCLLAGYEKGWATWSVYGKPLSHSFGTDAAITASNAEEWLSGVREAAWLGSGCEILLLGRSSEAVWLLEMARSAVTGCYSSANIFRTVLQTNTSLLIYRGYELPDLTTISAEPFLWHTARVPATYLMNQWPVRCAVISPDGRYVAVAGRRGLAHYSINSGRWKTFVSDEMENEFQVRGGMCWHQNVLVAAVEANRAYELRLYSRETPLDGANITFVQPMPAPVVLITPSGLDSLLVYTYDNLMYHFIFAPSNTGMRLVQVGQIGFHGIVRSPARVRGLSWYIPDNQLSDGDPSQDVAVASVMFLVDGKLVLLRPAVNAEGSLKYDMRVVAQSVEYYACMRDQPFLTVREEMENAISTPQSGVSGALLQAAQGSDEDLENSLWLFDGGELRAWTDAQQVLEAVSGGDLPATVTIPTDFYPLSVLLAKGIILGVEPDLVQRRDVNFSFFRFAIRTHLFLPEILRALLAQNASLPALRLAQLYSHLAYFPHALEVLLHHVLDEEVDMNPPPSPENALLPRVLTLLSSFPAYLDIVVQCTRKTELRSWQTLFAYLPPPQELFEESLSRGSLKTAGGYLLVLHTFDGLESGDGVGRRRGEQSVRLLGRAMKEGDWELCMELVRFLAALDDSGETLREALGSVGVEKMMGNGVGADMLTRLAVPGQRNGLKKIGAGSRSGSEDEGLSDASSADEGTISGTISPG